jgi:hypothetical protein
MSEKTKTGELETLVTITADETCLNIIVGRRSATLPRNHEHFDTLLTGYLHDVRQGLLALKTKRP